ncbi:MAG: hypothetical protein KC729_00120 [Candidatus Eisenbacteria bacterium]|uniref:Uncharacterized protein n=1 Tax=Eiseniibacteriota bacterium TaxID=2212470 RepID=A0A956RMU5_UNCEI|nr:hypothetical protein [Candidatus Eisenbacteria bacterium]
MRALFEDTAYQAANPLFRIDEIGLDVTDVQKRDIYLAVTKANGGDISITAYATRAEAQAGSGTALDSWTVSVPVSGPYTGAVLGIVLKVSGAVASGDVLDSVWCYTCAPDLVAMDNMRDLIREYTVSGAVLADFASADVVSGDVTPSSSEYEIRFFTESVERQVQDDTNKFWGPQSYTISVVIRHASLDDDNTDGELREAVFHRLRRYQAIVESILSDERRNSYTISAGQGGSSAAWRWIESVPPIPVDDPSGHFQIAISRYEFRVNGMWSDAIYPRS